MSEYSTAPALPVSAKVTAATLGAAVGTIIVYVAEVTTGVDLPGVVEGAVTVLTTFVAGYLKTDGVTYLARALAQRNGRHEA